MRDRQLLRNLEEKGYAFFSSDSNQSMVDIAQRFGTIFKVPTMPLVQTLTPRLRDYEGENTYSGNFGVDEFPYHTDLAHWYIPPRYLFLRCVSPVADVVTKIIDSKKICEDIKPDIFSRSHFKPRKKLDRTTNILKIKDGDIFRWDSVFIEPANDIAKSLKSLIEERTSSTKGLNILLDRAGDCLLIDNWRILHGRSSVNNESMGRIIERVYFTEVKI